MTYPVVVFVIAILATLGMLLFIVPVFAKMFTDLGGKLPLPTQILVNLSDALRLIAPIGVVLLIGGGIGWAKVRHTERVRQIVDPFKLRMPIFGALFQKVAISRFARNLGTMLASGVPILQSARDRRRDRGQRRPAGGRLVRAGQRAPRRVARRAAGRAQGLPADGRPDARRRRGHRRHGHDAATRSPTSTTQEVEATTEALTSLIEPLMIAVLGGGHRRR